jgi:peptidyl-prolyl cis-trans isomerase C
MKPLLPDITVNGETIPAALIAAEAQNHPAPKGKPGLAWQSAARALAIRTLLLQAARRRGLVAEPQEVAPGRQETEEEALVRQLLEASVVSPVVTEADLHAEYEAHPGRFRAPALYEAAHILLPVAAPEAVAAAEATARMILAELGEHPDRFADLARRHSACSSAANGGRLGQISAGDTVAEFEAALATMGVGTIAPVPVRSRYGLHIVRLDARAEGEVLPFGRVEAPLRRALERKAWERAARSFVAGLVEQAEIGGISLKAA